MRNMLHSFELVCPHNRLFLYYKDMGLGYIYWEINFNFKVGPRQERADIDFEKRFPSDEQDHRVGSNEENKKS